jgi:hypothetical protein
MKSSLKNYEMKQASSYENHLGKVMKLSPKSYEMRQPGSYEIEKVMK